MIALVGRARRAVLRRTPSTVAILALVACSGEPLDPPILLGGDGLLASRPGAPAGSIAPGVHRIALANSRDGLIVVPSTYDPDVPAPAAIFFHGAGGSAAAVLGVVEPIAEEMGIVLLIPDSRAGTWDLVRGGFGPDVEFVDRALAELFRRVRVDPARLSAAGFSDGASYALSLGATNGDLFSRLAAFSPGFYRPTREPARPGYFVVHGTGDRVLPIDQTSRPIVDRLRRSGFDVLYEEFDGGHAISLSRARAAFAWMAAVRG